MAQTLYIIDSHAHLYSAFHAVRGDLASPTGEPTNAVYGYTAMLLKLLREREPTLSAAAFDAGEATFRTERFAQYKANREAMPNALRQQIDRVLQLLTAMKVPVLQAEKYEADDVIATVVKQSRQLGHRVFICSKDKDLEQLLGPDVVMYDIKNDRILDEAWLKSTRGITPQQVPDFLALTGDTSDNIPGVPLIGPKIAAELIAKYGTLNNLLDHADEVPGKRGQNLREHKQTAIMSRELTGLIEDVPIELEWESLRPNGIFNPQVADIFSELGFARFLEQWGGPTRISDSTQPAGSEALSSADSATYTLIATEADLQDLAEKLGQQKMFAFDTETTDLNPVKAELCGISVSFEPNSGYYIPVKGPIGAATLPLGKVQAMLGPIFQDPNIAKCAQNAKYDLIVLERAGMPLANLTFDSMVASYVLDESRQSHGMDYLAEHLLRRRTIPISDVIGKGKERVLFDQVQLDRASEYAAEDADVTLQLHDKLAPMIREEGFTKLYTEVELPLVPVLAAMEHKGVRVDGRLLRKLSSDMEDRINALGLQIWEQAGGQFNIDSTQQLAEVLFEKLGLPHGRRTKTGYSTDMAVLETLEQQHPVPKLVLEYRQLRKLKSTYVDALPAAINPATGRVHASFNQTVAATGRLSSSDPNLQNIPVRSEVGRLIRSAFVAENDNVLITADYSQIELRILAHYSGDDALREAFAGDLDIHAAVAAQVFGVPIEQVSSEQRRRAKAVNFGIIYGQTPFGLARALGIMQSQAKTFIQAYFDRYRGVNQFIERSIDDARKNEAVETILGRRRRIPQINDRNRSLRSFAERTAVNTIIQGSAADLIKVAMINIHRLTVTGELESHMIMQVHDELVFECPQASAAKDSEIIREQMCTAISLDVPIKTDLAVAQNWMESK